MSKLSKRNKRITTAVAVVAILGVGGGAAYAYWTSTGHGSGTGTTGVATDFTVTGVSVTSGVALTPGGPSQTIGFTVNNPNTGNQILSSVVATVATTTGATWSAVPNCSALDYTVGTPTITYGVIAGGGSLTGSVVVSMNNLGSNQNACQGVAYPLYFAAS
jgi:hypothetical protein